MQKASIGSLTKIQKVICVVVLVLATLLTTLPMSLNWVWNEDSWGHHGQYEKMTDSILNGHLYMEYEVDPRLLEMDNPYDLAARQSLGVDYQFDHAFYDGHYYMYFGVIPVFLLFLPLRLLGITIAGSQGTQIFAAGAIVGFFALFYAIGQKYSKRLPMGSYLSVSCAVSFISLWYAVKYPALYCTAITSGICLSVWGIFFCFKAFVVDEEIKHTIIHGALGALLSALVFGCRPTIGLASIIYLPMIWHYASKKWSSTTAFQKLKVVSAFCMPYIVVAVLLMLYNYVRFDNPFEFGQSYQLTLADQHTYMSNGPVLGIDQLVRVINDTLYYFVSYTSVTKAFPHIHEDGLLVLFPVLFLGAGCFKPWQHKNNAVFVKGLCGTILFTVFVIIFMQARWSPVVLRRYSMDFNFLLGILVMFGVCRLFMEAEEAYLRRISGIVTALACLACVVCVLLFFTKGESAMADIYPELPGKVEAFLYFWK